MQTIVCQLDKIQLYYLLFMIRKTDEMTITIRQLRYFEALARCLHFGQAARDCSVTQPALSMQIKELEETLDVVLIERQASQIALTSSGEDVLKHVQSILDELNNLQNYSKHKQSALTGNLRIGVIPTVAPYLLPQALPELKEHFPDLKLKIRESLTEVLLRELKQNILDVAILALPIVKDQTLVSHALFKDHFLLATPARRKTTTGQKIEAIELINSHQLLLLDDGHCLRDQTLNFCHSAKVDNLSAFGATSLTTLIQMVINGQGMTLLPELARSSETLPAQHIELSRFAKPEPFRMIGMAWRRSSPFQEHFKVLGKTFSQVGKQILK
ncbi:MAG: LysR substrate-binding domain-containing protein [Pseudomonadota bacterium]